MTVSYSGLVSTAGFGTFVQLLFCWKASVYKLVWREMVVFIVLFAAIAGIYHHALNCQQRWVFDGLARYCESSSKIIPLTFVLGFYVSLVIDRWWSIIDAIGWPDRACYFVSMCLPSEEPQTVLYRRAIARYVNLAQLLVLRDVSTAAKTRFPTLDKVVADGFMTVEERQIFDSVKGENQLEKHNKYWLIIQWAINVLCRAHDRKATRNDFAFTKAFEEILAFRDKLGALLGYDWISIPLSYTQVVTLVVYAYFFTSLIGRQTLRGDRCCEALHANCSEIMAQAALTPELDRTIEKYAPIFPILEFAFYMGWLKVAESIMNPLGRDDDDVEINYIIDRNLAVSYGIVDSYKEKCPQVKQEIGPAPAMTRIKATTIKGSAAEFSPSENPDGTRKRRRHGRRLRELFGGEEGGMIQLGSDDGSYGGGSKSPTDVLKSKDHLGLRSDSPKSQNSRERSPVAVDKPRMFRSGSRLAPSSRKP